MKKAKPSKKKKSASRSAKKQFSARRPKPSRKAKPRRAASAKKRKAAPKPKAPARGKKAAPRKKAAPKPKAASRKKAKPMEKWVFKTPPVAIPKEVSIPPRKPAEKLPARKVEEFRRMLEAKREEITAAYRKNQKSAVEQYETDDTHDTGDVASSAYTRDFLLALSEKEQEVLRQINDALTRIQTGGYGLCEICGDSIPEPRLRLLPWATLCTPCQSLQEK